MLKISTSSKLENPLNYCFLGSTELACSERLQSIFPKWSEKNKVLYVL